MSDAPAADAAAAALLLAVDPAGLVGAALRAPPGPARDAWLARLRGALPAGTPWRRLPPGVPDSRLLGGLDLAATLAAGRKVAERGVLADAHGGIVLLAMAERIERATAARLCAVLDAGEALVQRDGLSLALPARIGVVALDEGAAPDEAPPPALLDRLAFRLEPDAPPAAGAPDAAGIAAARARLPAVAAGEEVVAALCGTAAALGIDSLRAPVLALRAARAAAALAGRDRVAAEDAALGARLVLAPRATCLPAEEPAEDGPPDTPPEAPPETPPEDAAPPEPPDAAALQE
ncbi:magnesium chelatase subunit D, partial [Falsiroseomonas sp. CW058]